MAAVEEIAEERLESYRVAAYPVFLRSGKKGLTWARFLADLGLGEQTSAGRKSRKMTRDQLAALYKKAAAIKKADQQHV